MFKLEIKTDSAAFEPDRLAEIARILHNLADLLEDGRGNGHGRKLLDSKGNFVGHYELT